VYLDKVAEGRLSISRTLKLKTSSTSDGGMAEYKERASDVSLSLFLILGSMLCFSLQTVPFLVRLEIFSRPVKVRAKLSMLNPLNLNHNVQAYQMEVKKEPLPVIVDVVFVADACARKRLLQT
jgi:hypothetical protein